MKQENQCVLQNGPDSFKELMSIYSSLYKVKHAESVCNCLPFKIQPASIMRPLPCPNENMNLTNCSSWPHYIMNWLRMNNIVKHQGKNRVSDLQLGHIRTPLSQFFLWKRFCTDYGVSWYSFAFMLPDFVLSDRICHVNITYMLCLCTCTLVRDRRM